DVTEQVRWERAAYGPEGVGDGRFRWTRPAGEVLVPVPVDHCGAGVLTDAVRLTVSGAAEKTKQVRVGTAQAAVGVDRSDIEVQLDAGVPAFDVINNVGGIVLRDGYGADRGFEEIDQGQYDEPVEVFNACGNGMAVRTELGAELGWFDDDFFMYYEDTDLSWRIRSRGWSIRYQPTAVLRHIHSASSKAWSPRWVFHVDRNRLLMLTKNASLPLLLNATVRYPLSAISMGLRAGAEAVRIRRRPALGPHLVRAKAFTSYLRMLPRMLARRARIGRAATVPRAELEEWLVTRR
ncbi:MAG: glycosyltransferase family 2 protein, partial [Actinomycetota bacterium]|nr:glycosyltransferase family 2 protein [Actinomycetota bacterium]